MNGGRGWVPVLLKPLLRWADARRDATFVRVFLMPLLRRWRRPTLMTADEVARTARLKSQRQRERRAAMPASDRQALDSPREDMVSIGLFACNRADLLRRTTASLAAYLREFGDTFRHEVILFHDGPNEAIREWAAGQPIFDRVVFNAENRGLSNNLNQFWFEVSRGRHLVDLEDDWVCEHTNNFVLHGIEVLDSDARVGCVRFERKRPADYRAWDDAFKIGKRILSADALTTPSGYEYRLLDTNPRTHDGVYANHAMFTFASVRLAGPIPVDMPRRAQEGGYARIYNDYWFAARGTQFADSPFVHEGYGRSCDSWDR